MSAVIADNLTKVYPGGKRALDGVDFSINEGGIYGFLGDNGAGKTTTVKLLSGMLQPTEGSCDVFGVNPAASPEKVHALSGVVTEKSRMYDHLSGLQNLMFFGALFGINKDESKRRALDLLEHLGLMDAKDRKLSAYSTGMRQRLSLARAMLHRPKILFLDEPTSGLDPESARNVNQLIKSLAAEKGTTVFLCTHQLRYAQEICTGYGLIHEGTLIAHGSLEELRALAFSGKTAVEFNADGHQQKAFMDRPFRKEGDLSLVDVDSQEEIPLLVKQIVEGGGKVYHVAARLLSLEETYLTLTKRRKEAGNA